MGHLRRVVMPVAVLISVTAMVALGRAGEQPARAGGPVLALPALQPPPFGLPWSPPAVALPAAGEPVSAARGPSTARDRARARRATLRRLRRSRSVRGSLRRQWIAGVLDTREYRRLRSTLYRSEQALQRLRGTRRAELGSVLAMVERLAATRSLTVSRLEPVFLTLRRNRDFWTRRALPAAGRRFTFGRDPVIFQYYPGRGLALQPLASFGRLNALAHVCLVRHPRFRCRPRALRRLAGRMLALAAERGGFAAWEYYFAFGGGAPPWISAMTQATGAQALGRAGLALHGARYSAAARRAVGALAAAAPLGTAVGGAGGTRYVMYSFAPRLQILNGELQALIGLRDAAVLTGSPTARRLFARGEPAARAALGAFDTGAWSRYSRGGPESTLGYHRLVTGFLAGLCRRTGRAPYCAAARRFRRYVHEPPRITVGLPARPRARRPVRLTYGLSKISRVRVLAWDRRGIQLHADARLARGLHVLRWVPWRRGRVRLRLIAIGPGGTRTVVRRTLLVRRARRVRRARSSRGGSPRRSHAAAPGARPRTSSP